MPQADRFYIGYLDNNTGLETDLKPYALPDNAFSVLNNAYHFRGRIRKRFGSRWFGDTQLSSRLRLNVGDDAITLPGGAAVGITDGAGNAAGNVPGGLYQLGQRFVIGAETDTVISNVAGAQPMMSTGPSTTHTFNIGTGAYVFAGAPINTQIYFFPNPAQTSAAGSIAGVLPYAPIPIGTMFSIGTVLFTVNALGVPANLLVANGTAVTATLNTTTGAFNFVGIRDNMGNLVINSNLYFYPALPVMGLVTYDSASDNNETTIGFDTQFAYQYDNTTGGWERLNGEITGGASVWTGNNSQFFWGTTWTGAEASNKVFFVTNFNENEPNFMRYFFNNQWNNFEPEVSAYVASPLVPSIFLDSALILVPFHNRLLAFNTWENVSTDNVTYTLFNYTGRVRYSQVGSPLDTNAWRQDIPGLGNAIDASTTEAITTVEFIKDRLVVYFERSTWELVYQGNQAYPFTWQQINTELGAESTFSIVPFDKIAIGVGNVGIHACNSQNVERIDNKIPQTVFDIHNADTGVERVYGIRDYDVEMVYWTFPAIDASTDFPYPTRVLVYNYKTGNWAFNDDSITVFGYFQPQTGITWDSLTVTWDDPVSWDSGTLQSQFQQVVAGNQEGYTFVIDADEVTNASVLQITNIVVAAGNNITITSIDHNLRFGDFICITNVFGTGNLNLLNNLVFEVITNPFGPDPNSFNIIYQDEMSTIIAGVYQGGGTIARVSRINLTTKEFNFYANKGRNAYLSKVDFLVDSTPFGRIEVDFFISSAVNSMVADSGPMGTNSLLGTSNLDTFPYLTVPLEIQQERLWHPVFFQADGEYIQLQLQLNDEQMLDPLVMICDFQLHALVIYAQPSSARLQ